MDKPQEHRVVDTELMNSLTMATHLTCSCGWDGNANRWNDHDPNVPPLPKTAPTPPISREALRRAIYGDRRCSRPWKARP